MSESFGTYRLLRLLGQGATATVQLAERTDSAEPIVVKRLRADVAHEPRFVQALRAEAELGLRLQHPSIVRVLELGEVDGEWLVTMEYVDGITLRALLQRDAGALPPRVALFVAARIADALAYAHALAGDDGRPLQLVHRDVNPTNIMLSKSGDVKLLDFGIARTAGLAHADTDPGARQGTLRYMSPEQARGLAVDSRSDQFSLGIVLYECLTGQRLFLGDDEWQTIRLICEAPIAAPSRLQPELGGDVDAVALTLLARDPAARFATTAAAAEALRRLAPSADDGAAELRALVARAATATTTPTPSQPAVITLDDGAPRSGFGRVVARAPLLLLFAFMLGVGAALFPGDPAASWRIARRSPRPALVVLGLANGTGRADDDWIAPTSQELLGIALAPSERLHVLDGDRVARMQRELDVRPAPSLSPADAARIGRDLDADLVVTGVVTRTPPQAHVALRVQETKSGATRALVDESGAERDLLTLLGRAATRLRATLGERLDSVAAAESSARALLPASIDAARAYADGVARLRDGDFVHAREQLARAVALDPQNARAHLMLARLLANVGYAADARDEADRAFALRLALPRELRLIVAAERDRLNKRWRDAIDRDQLLFQLFPDNLEYGLALVHAQWDGAANRAARATVQTLLALPGRDGRDPRVEIAHAVVANGMGARDESDRAAAHALQLAQARGSELQIADAELLQSQAAWKDCAWATARARAAEATFRRLGDPRDAVAARQVIGLCLQRQGDSAGALAAFEDNIARTTAVGDRLNLSTALGDAATALNDLGRRADAAERFERSLALRRQLDQPWQLADALVNLTYLELLEGRVGAATAHIEEALPAAKRSGDPQLMLDTWLARQQVDRTRGDATQAADDHAQRAALAKTLDPGAYTDDSEDILDDSYLWEARGRPDEATRAATAARRRFLARQDAHAAAVAALRVATLTLATARERAETSVRAVLAQADREDAEVLCAGHETLARARLAAHDAGGAARELERARAAAPGEPSFALTAALTLTGARVAAARGQGAAATRALRQLVARCRAAGHVALALEARLAEVELPAARNGRPRADTRQTAQALADEAARRGFVAIARAATAIAAPGR